MFYVLDFSNNSPVSTSTVGDKISFEFLFEIFLEELRKYLFTRESMSFVFIPQRNVSKMYRYFRRYIILFSNASTRATCYKIKVT